MRKSIAIIFILFMFYNVICYDDNCQTLDTDSRDLCLECKTGFYLTYDQRYCEECDLQQGKILYSNYKHSGGGMMQNCYTKVENCEEYASNDDFCAICKVGFKRDENGQCVQCGANEVGMLNVCFKKIDHCYIYYLFREGEKCFVCEENYEFNEEQHQCIKCPDGEVAEEGFICKKECPLGKVLSYRECIDKIPNCNTYAQSGKCSKCYDNYELKEDGTCSKCPEGTTGTGLKCYDIMYFCAYQIDDKCEHCSSGDEVLNEEKNLCFKKEKIQNCDVQINDKCKICENGYKPSKDQKSCEICEPGKDEDILTCLNVENCLSHYSIHNNYKKLRVDCISCVSNEYYLTTSLHQCNDCEKGKYKLNGQCIDEIKNCVKYKSESICEQCRHGYQVKNGECSPCVKPYKGSDGKTCYLPHFRCKESGDDDYGNCHECIMGYTLNSQKLCVREGLEHGNESNNNSFGLNINFIFLILYELLIQFFDQTQWILNFKINWIYLF